MKIDSAFKDRLGGIRASEIGRKGKHIVATVASCRKTSVSTGFFHPFTIGIEDTPPTWHEHYQPCTKVT